MDGNTRMFYAEQVGKNVVVKARQFNRYGDEMKTRAILVVFVGAGAELAAKALVLALQEGWATGFGLTYQATPDQGTRV